MHGLDNLRATRERGDGVSATGLVATTWQEARKRPGSLVLAFWYLFIVVIFEFVTFSRMGPDFSSWISRLTTSATVPALSGALAFKLGLVYLTFILIVFPFSVGGLGGGVASALEGQDNLGSLFAFFGHAVQRFWMSLGLVAGALVASAILYVAVALFMSVASFDTVAAVVTRLIGLGVLIFWLATLFYWAGAVFLGQESVLWALWHGVRWAVGHAWFAFRVSALVIGLLIAAVVIFALVAELPIIGSIISMVASGALLTLLTTFAMVLYRSQAALGPPDAKPIR
jgi:hypothetical protein